MGLYKVDREIIAPLGESLTPGAVVELPNDHEEVRRCVAAGKLIPASVDGSFPDKLTIVRRPCCGG